MFTTLTLDDLKDLLVECIANNDSKLFKATVNEIKQRIKNNDYYRYDCNEL